MAFGKVGTGTYAGSSWATSTSVAMPTGVAEGDIMFALLARLLQEDVVSAPAGWTALQDNPVGSGYRWWLYYKVAGESEAGPYQWSWTNSQKTMGLIVAYRDGFDTADPIDTSSKLDYANYNATLRAAGVTVAAADSPLLMIGGAAAGSEVTCSAPTSPGTFTEDLDTGNTTPDFWGFYYSLVVAAGATGNVDATLSASTANKTAFLVALNPPAAAGISIPLLNHLLL